MVMPVNVGNDDNTINGLPFTVVEPGSAADPFAARSAPSPASPATVAQQVVAPEVSNPQQTPAATTTTPAATPPPVTPAQPQTAPSTPQTELSPMQKAIAEGTLDDYIATLVKENTGSALRTQQSSYDKRIDALQKDLKESREAAARSEREAKLNNEDLTDEEKATLRKSWELEDKATALSAYETELDGYFRAIYATRLASDHAQFGVTAEELEQFSEPEEMDAFVAQKELDFYRSGRHLAPSTNTVPDRSVQAPGTTPNEPVAPAGASAPTDIGGNAPVSLPAELSKEVGPDAMLANLNKLPWETPLPN